LYNRLGVDYRQAGVDIDAGNDVVRRIKRLAKSTYTPGVLAGVGSFGGLFALGDGGSDADLVACADGVGTKLKVAILAGVHNTVGVDLVNHCVNDILVQGARPLFFLDYLATGRLSPDVAEQVVAGVAGACRANGCALLGGETAEMPGFYGDGDYDLAGFIVGQVSRVKVIDGTTIQPGDVLIALASSGLHTNGYSLARKVAFEVLGLGVDSYVPELQTTVGDALLAPHRSYLASIVPLIDRGGIKGMAHITGGGIPENLPRTLPAGRTYALDFDSWTVPPIFRWLQSSGRVPSDDMFRTFNMGVGLILVASPEDVDSLLSHLGSLGESAWVIGSVH
jgi:phosphoribosylformylglycinamidine cyclo-ligase